jgi:hypothetical protein
MKCFEIGHKNKNFWNILYEDQMISQFELILRVRSPEIFLAVTTLSWIARWWGIASDKWSAALLAEGNTAAFALDLIRWVAAFAWSKFAHKFPVD